MNHMFKQILQGDFYSERDFTAKMPRDFFAGAEIFWKVARETLRHVESRSKSSIQQIT